MEQNMYPEIEITDEDLREIVYFILMKFQSDGLHIQGTSSKRDLLGGYIERWFNKSAETIVFNKLLENKPYKVIPDYFLYGNDSDKNAPDLLGLEVKNKVIPFVKYRDGTWENISNMPRVEVKVVRKDQYLVGVREPQMIDDYYVFIESDLSEDYLARLFADEVFSEKYFKNLQTKDEFIASDKDSQIIPHNQYRKPEKIGTYRLLGIYKRDDFKNGTVLCGKKVSPLYFSNAENIEVRGDIIETIAVKNEVFSYSYAGNVYLPMHISGTDKIKVVKKNKTTFYLETPKQLKINGVPVNAGRVKISFKLFERSSNWEENVITKNMLPLVIKDSTQELISIFDKISRG